MQLVDTDEAASILRVSPRTLTQWRWLGRGPKYRKHGARVLYPLAELERWSERQARTSTSDPGPEAAHSGRPAA